MRAFRPMTSLNRRSTRTPARWRVAVLGPRDASMATLNAAVTQAGGRVVIEAPARPASLTLMARAAPDVLILNPPEAAGGNPDLVSFTSSGHPVVLFTHDTSRPLLTLAARSGVTAFLVAPLEPSQLPPTLDLAVARFDECKVLRRKLADRTAIERAKGRLMAALGLTEDDAFRWLRTRAMETRSTLGGVARSVLEEGALGLLSSCSTPHPPDRPLYSQVRIVHSAL